MSAVQEAMGLGSRGLRRRLRWPWRWPLLAMPTSFIVYVVVVLACDLALTGWELAGTHLRAEDLLLPPFYALIAPFVIGAVLYLRARRIPVYRRVFSSAALGLAGAATSATFHLVIPDVGVVTLAGSGAWLTRPPVVLTAVACAVVFAVVNSFTVAVAAHLAGPEASIKQMLGDREALLLDLTETCVGVLVAVTCVLSYLLLLVALPPVILLQRSLMHQQLAHAPGQIAAPATQATAQEDWDEATDGCP